MTRSSATAQIAAIVCLIINRYDLYAWKMATYMENLKKRRLRGPCLYKLSAGNPPQHPHKRTLYRQMLQSIRLRKHEVCML